MVQAVNRDGTANARSQDRSGGPVRALEPRYYTDPDIFAREAERIFFRTWQFAGHVSQLVRAGDYVTLRLIDQGLFLMRGGDGEIRGFYNVCQHRAHELVQGAGNLRSIVCPYHAWSYEFDGRLKRARNSAKVQGFDRNAICLTRVRVETLCGFLFVNLDAAAAPIGDCFPEVAAGLREYLPHLDRLQPVEWVTAEERCNWKVSVENYSECYHCGVAHPSFTRGVIDPRRYDIRADGRCLRHTTTAVDRAAMSYAIDASDSEHAADYSSWFLWPAFSIQVYPGGMLNTYHWRPLAVDRTEVVRGWYAPDGERNEAVATLAELDRTTTLAEDVGLVESVQRGLKSRQAGPLVLDPDHGVDSEHSIEALKSWLLEALAD